MTDRREQVEAELEDVRSQLRGRVRSGLKDGSAQAQGQVTSVVGTAVLGAFVVLALLLAVVAVAQGDVGGAVFFGLVTAGGAWVLRRNSRTDVDLERAALVERERGLVEELTALDPTSPALSVPVDRQPGAYAQMMHDRFSLGPSPADALQRLGPDAPRWLVAFHRRVGWGIVAALVLAAAMVGLLAQI